MNDSDIEVISGDQSSGDNIIHSSELALPDEVLPEQLYVIPVEQRPFFPAQVQPIVVSRSRWEETLKQVAKSGHNCVGLVYAGDKDAKTMLASDCPQIGCVVRLHNVTIVDDEMQLVAQGIKRFSIDSWIATERPFVAQVSYPADKRNTGQAENIKAHAIAMLKSIKDLLPLNPLYSEELKHYLNHFSPNDPSPLTDFAAAITMAKGDELQAVLESLSLLQRMEKVLILLRKEIEVAQLQTEISAQVNDKISAHQREFFLKEQLKIIQKELGVEKDDQTSDSDEFH